MRPIYETAWFGPWVARSSSILTGARRSCVVPIALVRRYAFIVACSGTIPVVR